MIKSIKRLALLFFGLMAGSTIFFSCTDVDKTLGLDLIPDDEKRDFKESTLCPDAYTYTLDSVYTYSPSVFMIGSHFDPMFGETTSGSTFQILPISDSTDFGTNPTYESAILRLIKAGAPIGNENASQTISVYELTERIYYDSVYYACTPIKETLKGQSPIVTVSYNGEDTLNIELGPVFGNKLLTTPKDIMMYDEDTLYHSRFFDYIKGFYVEASSSSGNERMNFFNPHIGLYLTYSNADSANITQIYDNMYTYSTDYNNNVTYYYYAQFNTVEHDYTKADQSLQFPDTAKINNTKESSLYDFLYVQGLFGAVPYIKITRAKLNSWLQEEKLDASQVAIIRAELIMELEEFSGFDITKYPSALGGMLLLNPLVTYSAYYGNMYAGGYLTSFYYAKSLFDGTLNTTHRKYSVNLTHEILDQLKGDHDLVFYLTPYASNSGEVSYNTLFHYIAPSQYKDYRAVIKGPKHPTSPLKLVLTYAIPQ